MRYHLIEKFKTTLHERLIIFFQEKGYRKLGKGHFGAVFSNGKNVIKVFKEDRGYENFLKFAQSHPNKHYPVIVKGPLSISGTELKMVKLEKLFPLSKEDIEKLHIFLFGPSSEEENTIWKADEELFNAFRNVNIHKGDNLMDLHSANVMKRSDGTFVITDPWIN
jgi:hypothetical protein